MSHAEYDLIVYIGRFQPLHRGHEATIERALKLAQKTLVLVGSAYTSRSIKNPFSFDERKKMIVDKFPYNYMQEKNLCIEPVIDTVYNDSAWVNQVRFKALEACPKGRVAIIGHEKDDSSYYLKMFPDWEWITVEEIKDKEGNAYHSTDIRESVLSIKEDPQHMDNMPPAYPMFMKYMPASTLNELFKEYEYIQEYKQAWEASPFPPTFNCSDAVVIQSGHILLVERDGMPGRGTYAIPGGFINPNEKALTAAVRELREETRLKVPEKVLYGSVFDQHVFDAPDRSVRGRTFSHAFGFKLDDSHPLPEVRGADDAKHAMWVPFEVFHTNSFREKMFEDHASILDWFLARI